jgi:hypothetical protein
VESLYYAVSSVKSAPVADKFEDIEGAVAAAVVLLIVKEKGADLMPR